LDLDDWLARAAKEEDRNLHAFNFERETAFGLPALLEAHRAFDAFLEPIPDSDPRGADELLAAFVKGQSLPLRGYGAAPTDARYIEPGLRTGPRRVFLRSIAVQEHFLIKFGLDPRAVITLLRNVGYLVERAPLDDAAEDEVQTLVKGVVPSAPPPAGSSRVPHRIARGRVYRGGAPVQYGSQPWWFTFEDTLDAEYARLSPTATSLERSGYVAGLRATLGVYHPSDGLADALVAAAGNVKYRIYLQIAAEGPGAQEHAFNQPALFSAGIPELFVSHPRGLDGGITVRLKDMTCVHDSACACAADGLPEGVVPAYIIMDDMCTHEVRDAYFALHRDLARYVAPSCDDIRARRAAP
jgi:hypothetical protein